MKIKLLFLFSIFGIALGNAQCGTFPPPPGLHAVYALDVDNDGIATFDMAYFITYFHRPFYENAFNETSVGYDFLFVNLAGDALPLMYTNSIPQPDVHIDIIYNGNGPEFQPQPPCYYPNEWVMNSGLRLTAVPFDQDMDEDGILNADEDTNHNLNLMDDDEDQDGIINLKDNFNNLANVEHPKTEISIYPNPITDGHFTFNSNAVVLEVTLFDLTGKQLYNSKISSNEVNVADILAGVYLLKFQSEKGSIYKKIVVN